MNTITFSSYEASTTGKSTLSSGNGYNVEIRDEEKKWSIWAVAERRSMRPNSWSLSHIRFVGSHDEYPSLHEISSFSLCLDAYIDDILNKLIPNP